MKVTNICTGMSYLKGYKSRKNRLIVRSKKIYNQLKIKYGFWFNGYNGVLDIKLYSRKSVITLDGWSENISGLSNCAETN